jgi:glucokinase
LIGRGGIDLGGTKIQALVVDGNNKVKGEARRPTPTTGGPKDVTDAMTAAMEEAAEAAGLKTSALKGIGVGSPGSVDAKTGIVSQANNLPGWDGEFPMGPTLEKELGAPVKIGGDVQVGTNAEFKLGAGRDYDSMIGVFWGTGVGGGVVLDGELWKGRGEAGEIGHMVVKMGGAKCPCGRRGCMEAYAGRKAMEAEARKRHDEGKKTDLFKIMKKRDRTRLTSGVWARAVDDKDKLALHLIDRAVEALGAGIASAVNLLDVEAVVIGGGMGTRFGEPYVKKIAAEMKPHLFLDKNPPDVRLVGLGDYGGGIGAALLVK